LSWTAPADDGGAPVSGYAVTVKPAPKGAHAVTVNGSTRTATVTGLVSGTSYAFTVDASNRVKGKGPASSKVTLAGTRVTVKAPLRPVTVAAGKAARITATVTNSATKKPVAHRAVTLLSRVVGTTTWARTASAKTNAKGTVALTVKPRSNTQYELAFAGVTNALAGSLSRTVVVGVAPKVTIAATSRSAKHGAAVMIYGTTSPADTGAVVHLQVLVGRTWKPLAVKAVVSSQLLPNHHTAVGYVLTYQPTKRGKQSLRVAVAATSSYGASLSGRLSLTVR
jgi:titin